MENETSPDLTKALTLDLYEDWAKSSRMLSEIANELTQAKSLLDGYKTGIETLWGPVVNHQDVDNAYLQSLKVKEIEDKLAVERKNHAMYSNALKSRLKIANKRILIKPGIELMLEEDRVAILKPAGR